MNPEEPFYLLDEGGQQIRPLFYPMLNKSMLEAWLAYLWARGREQGQRARLVVLLNGGAGQGYAAWRGVVQAGLSRRTPSNLESQR